MTSIFGINYIIKPSINIQGLRLELDHVIENKTLYKYSYNKVDIFDHEYFIIPNEIITDSKDIVIDDNKYIYTGSNDRKCFLIINFNYKWNDQKPPRYSFKILKNNEELVNIKKGVYDSRTFINTITDRLLIDLDKNDVITIELSKELINEVDNIEIIKNSFIIFEFI
jgi:hypothetical protein